MNLLSLSKIIPVSTLLFTLFFTPISTNIAQAQGRPSFAGQSGNPFYGKELEKARREINKAREEAFFVNTLSQQVQSSQMNDLGNLAQKLLNSATQYYQSGDYFKARSMAKASKDIYKAVQSLQQREIGYVATTSRRGLSKSYFEAPYKVTQELSKTEAEMNYYRSNNSTVANLLNQARSLAQPASSMEAVSSLNNLEYLANNRAAVYLAKAARHLMKVERGF